MGDLTYGLALKGPLKKKNKQIKKRRKKRAGDSNNNDVSPVADKRDKLEKHATRTYYPRCTRGSAINYFFFTRSVVIVLSRAASMLVNNVLYKTHSGTKLLLLKNLTKLKCTTHQVRVERRRVDARVRVLVGGRVRRVHGRGGRSAPVAGVVRRQRRGRGQLTRAHGHGGLRTGAVARSGGGATRAATGGAHHVGRQAATPTAGGQRR